MSDKDPLAHILAQGKRDPHLRLHKPTPAPAPVAETPVGPREYQAFETGDRPARLIIQCANGPSHSPAYGLLVNVIFDRRFASSFVLAFNFMVVTVVGRNLAAVVHAINHHRCATITEFDPQAFDLSAEDQPLIERIEVKVGAPMASLAERLPS
jgi:hypothetical protein